MSEPCEFVKKYARRLVVRDERNCVGSEEIAKTSIIAYTRRPVDVGGYGSDACMWRQR